MIAGQWGFVPGLILPRLPVARLDWMTSFSPHEFSARRASAGRDGDFMMDCRTVWGFPRINSAVVDCGAVELNDLIFRRTSFPQEWLFIVIHQQIYTVQKIQR